MYVGRTIDNLRDIPYEKWTIEELAYHQDTMKRFAHYLNDSGRQIYDAVQKEIESRGGLPVYGGDYDHPYSVTYD